MAHTERHTHTPTHAQTHSLTLLNGETEAAAVLPSDSFVVDWGAPRYKYTARLVFTGAEAGALSRSAFTVIALALIAYKDDARLHHRARLTLRCDRSH